MTLATLILKLLSDEELLRLFQKLILEESVVNWPPSPQDENEKKLAQELHIQILLAGSGRNRGALFAQVEMETRAELLKLHQETGGIIWM
jgi:hypothetical protein